MGTLFKLGLESANVRTVISWGLPKAGTSGLIGNILVANLAQPILSFIYFTYNGTFTCMLASREWSRFAVQRKGLRISGVPEGSQRSTYFLQLPYRFAIPIMILSGVLHWLVSQSIFLVAVQRYTPWGIPIINWKSISNEPLKGKELTCGYSPIAILCVILVGIFMIVLGAVMGSRRYAAGMPLVGSCSAAISAACHSETPNLEHDLAISRIQWGVTRSTDVVSHCAFSTREVTFPVEGHLYAGKSSKLKTD